MSRIGRIDRAISAALKAISVASLCALFVTIAFVVTTRLFALKSAGWTDELIELAFAWLLFPCAASLWRVRGHFTVDLLEQTIREPARRRKLLMAIELLCLVFLAVLFYEACVFVVVSASETSPVFGYSRVFWYGVMPLAAAIMIGYSVARVVALAKGKELVLS